jgi:hypothetical protein
MLQTIRRTSARSAELTKQEDCTICQKSMSLRNLKKHIASHQQQLALFALPPNVDETEAEEREDEERSPIIAEDDEDSLDVAQDDADFLGSVEDSDGFQAVAWSTDNDDASESNEAPTHPSLHQAQEEDSNGLRLSWDNKRVPSPYSPDDNLRADLDVEFEGATILSQYIDVVTTEMGTQDSNDQRHDTSISEISATPTVEEVERNEKDRSTRSEYRKDPDEENTNPRHNPKLPTLYPLKTTQSPPTSAAIPNAPYSYPSQSSSYDASAPSPPESMYHYAYPPHSFTVVSSTVDNEKRIDDQQQFQLPSETLPSKIQPTYEKIHQKYLDTDTLHYYDIPYEFDSDPDHLIVLRDLNQREFDVLFEHSRRLQVQREKYPERFPRKENEGTKYSTGEKSEAPRTTQNKNTGPGPGPASPPPLPEGWIAHLDPSYGQYYYIHLPTQSTQWEFPKGPTPLNLNKTMSAQSTTPSFQTGFDEGVVRPKSQDSYSMSEEVATKEQKGESRVVEHIPPHSTEEEETAFWVP